MKNNKCRSGPTSKVINLFCVLCATMLDGLVEYCKSIKKVLVYVAFALFAIAWVVYNLPGYNFEPLIRTSSVVSAVFEGAGVIIDDCKDKEVITEYVVVKDCKVLLNADAVKPKVHFGVAAGIVFFIAGVLAHSNREKPATDKATSTGNASKKTRKKNRK